MNRNIHRRSAGRKDRCGVRTSDEAVNPNDDRVARLGTISLAMRASHMVLGSGCHCC
jgi:hypothetical protein